MPVARSSNTISLSASGIRAEIDPASGNLSRLFARRRTWSDRPGRLIITDDLLRRTFDDRHTKTNTGVRRLPGGVRIEKRFPGAEFNVVETWRAHGDHISWSAEVALKPGKRERSIEIRQLLPYPPRPYGLGAWTGRSDFPTTIERLGNLELQYGELCYGTVFPSLTLYRKEENVGLTITKPFGLKTGRLSFLFGDYRGAGIGLKTSMCALRPGRPVITRFLIRAHEGCWRPGLAWLYRLHRDYFEPPNPRVRSIEGGYLLAHPFMTDEEIGSMLPHGLKWEELHCHFPWYGDYLPDAESWTPIDTWEACVAWDQAGGAAAEQLTKRAFAGRSTFRSDVPITRSLLREHIARVHKRKVKSLYYWQCAGDASPCIQERHPDAVARDENGAPYPGAADSTLMNADPETSFGKAMLKQISRIYEIFPELDGIFLDQLCYGAIDYAHDDGFTMVNNRPAYDLWRCYEAPVRRLAEVTHRRDKLIFANGPYNVEVQREVDGIMAEGRSWLADTMQYLCISKPLLFLDFYHDDARRAERMFQCCLLAGASYSLFPHPPPAVAEVIGRYRPMVEMLFGRRWLLEPDPLTLPEGIAGNIFRAQDRDVLVSLVSTSKSCLDRNGITRQVEVRCRFRGARDIRTAHSLGTHYGGRRKVRIAQKAGREITLVLPEHSAATLIVLKSGRP